MDPRPIQHDTWVCGNCTALNLIATADTMCPLCGHTRDYGIGCCTNPGELLLATGLFPGHPEYQNSYSSSERGAYYQTGSSSDTAFNGCTMVDSPVNVPESFNNLWYLEIGESESQVWCDMQRSGCGVTRWTSPPLDTSEGAGSVGEGVWVCTECECPNSDICPACMSCGADRP